MTAADEPLDPAVSSAGQDRRVSRRGHALPFRISLILTLALLPLGILSVWQTSRAFDAAVATYRAGIEARTAAIARPKRDVLVRAMEQAEGLASTLALLDPDPAACRALMNRAAQSAEWVRFVGFLDLEKQSGCNNYGEEFDFSGTPKLADLQAAPERHISFNPSGQVSGEPVFIVVEPVVSREGKVQGFVALSLVNWTNMVAEDLRDDDALVVTFNDSGDILSSSRPRDNVGALLPGNVPLEELVGSDRRVFRDEAASGAQRDFVLVPIIEDEAYALGSWRPGAPFQHGSNLFTFTLTFPLLMWLITLSVLLIAMQHQVIKPLRRLGRKMRSFSDGRRVFHTDDLRDAPTELYEIGATFEQVAKKMAEDEASLQSRLFERDVLLKEVHHRVKNNLQLMSSIMNMQTRRAQNPEVRQALRRVQNRISSLATIHRGLYHSAEVSQVRVDTLIDKLFSELLSLAGEAVGKVRLDMHLEPLTFLPDQAGPLAMLATEGFTNALKYARPGPSGEVEITIELAKVAGDTEGPGRDVLFRISNPVGDMASPETDEDGGIGSQLIATFVNQLGGTYHDERAGGAYVLEVRFAIQDFEAEPASGN